MSKAPNPGSEDALAQGCLCPVLDNAHGEGLQFSGGQVLFWMDGDCPLHGLKGEKEEEEL